MMYCYCYKKLQIELEIDKRPDIKLHIPGLLMTINMADMSVLWNFSSNGPET